MRNKVSSLTQMPSSNATTAEFKHRPRSQQKAGRSPAEISSSVQLGVPLLFGCPHIKGPILGSISGHLIVGNSHKSPAQNGEDAGAPSGCSKEFQLPHKDLDSSARILEALMGLCKFLKGPNKGSERVQVESPKGCHYPCYDHGEPLLCFGQGSPCFQSRSYGLLSISPYFGILMSPFEHH